MRLVRLRRRPGSPVARSPPRIVIRPRCPWPARSAWGPTERHHAFRVKAPSSGRSRASRRRPGYVPSDQQRDNLRAAAFPLADPHLAAGSAAIAPPRGFGLIGETLPFVRTSLEQALARFLTRIEGLGWGRPGLARITLKMGPVAGSDGRGRRRRGCPEATVAERMIGDEAEDENDPRGADRPARAPWAAQPPLIEAT